MKIITNNILRKLVYGFELPEKYRKDFDYLSDEDYETNHFVVYRDNVYDLSEFMNCHSMFDKQWHGYASDTYFSGVLVRIVDDESVIVARYYS